MDEHACFEQRCQRYETRAGVALQTGGVARSVWPTTAVPWIAGGVSATTGEDGVADARERCGAGRADVELEGRAAGDRRGERRGEAEVHLRRREARGERTTLDLVRPRFGLSDRAARARFADRPAADEPRAGRADEEKYCQAVVPSLEKTK